MDGNSGEGGLSAVAGDGVTVAGMTAADKVRARLLAEVVRILGTGDELASGLARYGAIESLSQLAWRRWKFQGGVGSDLDHAIAVAVQTCLRRQDPALACRYLSDENATIDLAVILVAAGRTPAEAIEGIALIGIEEQPLQRKRQT